MTYPAGIFVDESGYAHVPIAQSGTTTYPSAGTWRKGDLAQATGGGVYICTAAGTPGTWAAVGSSGSGDVVGPASATDNRFAIFDSTTGKLIKVGSYTEADFVAQLAAIQAAAEPIAQRTLQAQTNDYTLVLGDTTKTVTMTKATAIVLTVPTNASVAFSVGTKIEVQNLGAGACTITPAGGVTVNGDTVLSQYSTVKLEKTATNTWLIQRTGIPRSYLDTDGTLAANSDSKVATQKAVKTYADAITTAAAATYPTKAATTDLVDAAGDLLVGTADNTLGKLAKGTALQVLRTNAGATALEWATAASGSVATDAIWDAAGDLAYGTGADTATRLAKGTAYQMLRINSGATAPEWVSGGAQLITETVLGSDTASFDFTSIPATFRHLLLVWSLRTDAAAAIDTASTNFNNDTTNANYDREFFQTVAASTTALEKLATTASRSGATITGNTAPASHFGQGHMLIHNYANTSFYKVATVEGSQWSSRSSNGMLHWWNILGWANTAAISRVTFTPVTGSNFKTSSVMALYGIG